MTKFGFKQFFLLSEGDEASGLEDFCNMILVGHIEEEGVVTLVFADAPSKYDARHLYQIYLQLSGYCEEENEDLVDDDEYDEYEFEVFQHPHVDDSGFELRDDDFVYVKTSDI